MRPGVHYTARYMESTLPPGVVSAMHAHAGPEAFYTVSGAQCLETPDGITVSRAGESTIVDPGPPMAVSAVGADTRRAIFLVLHDSAQPWMTRVSSWLPTGRCPH
jgi:quercetin dioxygenase-like cupin family protein